MRDRFDIFGTLPDVIEDDWIDDIENFDERLREYTRRRARATAFGLRYAADVEAPGQQCSYMARAEGGDLDRAYGAHDAVVSSERSFSSFSRLMLRPWSKSIRPRNRLSVLGTLSLAVAGILIGLAVLWIVPGLVDSSQQQALHRAAVHRDNSIIRTGVTANFKTPVVLYYRDVNGRLHRLLADASGINQFANETLIYLDTECQRIKVNTAVRIDALLATAFDDRQASIAAYADWYFDWGRSWALLKEASIGGLKGFAPNNVQGIVEASRNEVESYLVRNYQRFVLMPELRDPVIGAGISRILADAHGEYLAVVATIDDRVQEYLNRYTQHLEPRDPLAKLDVSLGWNQQQWKAPRYAVDDEAFRAVTRGAVAALVAASVKPAIERAILPIFANAAARVVASMRPQIIGAAAGSVFEPGLGTLAGWAVGVGSGLASDYFWNKNRERLDRPDFESANAQALDATVQEWSRAIQRDLFSAIDVWFDDTSGVVAEFKIRRKIPTG
jgi:hypothetical protein